MPATNHAKALKGLSIASLIISALMIVLYTIAAISMSVVGNSLLSGDYYSTYLDYYSMSYMYDDLYDDYVTGAAVAGIFNMLIVLFIVGAIFAIACLVASILALRANDKPEKYGMVFAWSIVGAILGVLNGGIVLTVLFIIMAVFANKDKKLYQAGAYFGGAPSAPYVQYGAYPGQPYPQGQPQQYETNQSPMPPASSQPAPAPVQPPSQPAQPAPVQAYPAAQPYSPQTPSEQAGSASKQAPPSPQAYSRAISENGENGDLADSGQGQ